MIWCQPRSDNEHDDDKNKNEDSEDDDVNSPQILVESFSLCNNFVMGAAVSAPSNLEEKILIRVQNQISGRRQSEKPAHKRSPMLIKTAATFARIFTNLN